MALELATSGTLDLVVAAARRNAAHGRHARLSLTKPQFGLSPTSPSRCAPAPADADELAELRSRADVGPLLEEVAACRHKVELARWFHNDVVVSARALRSRRRVRWLRLTGRAAELRTVDLDDVPPPGALGRRLTGLVCVPVRGP